MDNGNAYYHPFPEVYRTIKFLDMFVPFSPLEIVYKRNYSIFGLTCHREYCELLEINFNAPLSQCLSRGRG
jgi:hypothetical protein